MVSDSARASIDGIRQDLGDAFRSFRAAPLVTLIAISSLALGIGANTAIFSLVNSLLLRPLPVRDPCQFSLTAAGWEISFVAAAAALLGMTGLAFVPALRVGQG